MSENRISGAIGGFTGRMTVVWISIGALPAELILHKNFGRRYLGIDALLAIIQMILGVFLFGFYAANSPNRDEFRYHPGPLSLYLLLYGVALLGARMSLRRHERRGETEHSRYNGFPRLLPVRFARFERSFKLVLEPAVVFFAAGKLWSWNLPLGFFLAFNAVCMCWGNLVNVRFERRKAMDLQDAMIEQRANAQSLRGFASCW